MRAIKKHRRSGALNSEMQEQLLDLAFFEFHVLANDGVIFLDRHLFRHCAGVLFGDVEKARVSCAVEADFGGRGFCHFVNSCRHARQMPGGGVNYDADMRQLGRAVKK